MRIFIEYNEIHRNKVLLKKHSKRTQVGICFQTERIPQCTCKNILTVRFSLCCIIVLYNSRVSLALRESCIESGLPFIQVEPRRFIPRVVKLTADLTRGEKPGEA